MLDDQFHTPRAQDPDLNTALYGSQTTKDSQPRNSSGPLPEPKRQLKSARIVTVLIATAVDPKPYTFSQGLHDDAGVLLEVFLDREWDFSEQVRSQDA